MMCAFSKEGKFDFGVVSGVDSLGGGGDVLRKKRSWRREGQVINQANNQATCLLSVRSLCHIIGRGSSQ